MLWRIFCKFAESVTINKTIMRIKSLFLTVFVMTMMSCTNDIGDNPAPAVVTDDKPFKHDKYIDSTVRPGDDFFRYACGKWIDDASLSYPLNETSNILDAAYGQMFILSDDPVMTAVRQLVAAAETDDSADRALLKSRIDYLESITTQEELLAAFSQLHQWGYMPLLRLSCFVSNGVICPFLNTEKTSFSINNAMTVKDDKMLGDTVWELCYDLCDEERGFGFTYDRALEIYHHALEVERLEMDTWDFWYNMRCRELRPKRNLTRNADSQQLVQQVCELMGIGELADQMSFINYQTQSKLIEMLLEGSEESIAMMRDYLICYVMGQDFLLIPSLTPHIYSDLRVKEAMTYSRHYLFRVTVEFVKEAIHKEECVRIMEELRQLLIERIGQLDWMSEATKLEAQKKAWQMTYCIGYPDQWNEEFTLRIERTTLLEAVSGMRRQAAEQMHRLIGRDMQTHGWDYWVEDCPSWTMNAFYEPSSNQLCILPGELMAPLFDPEQSEAALYAHASTFGHEICHGFDAGGSSYDETGAMRDWWTDEDRAVFEQKQQQLIDLWNQLEHYPGQSANGQQTLNENIADLGGATLALEAYMRRIKAQGFTGQQYDEQLRKFWLSYALLRGADEAERDLEMLKNYYVTDSHSAGHNRVNGIARLIDDWYRLYDVKPSDKLYVAPEDRVKIW